MTAHARLAAVLDVAPPLVPEGSTIDGVVVSDGIAYVSGVVAFRGAAHPTPGKVGRELTVAEGAVQAGLAVANGLYRLEQTLGSLDRIDRILKLTVFVNATANLVEHPAVADGGSRVLSDVLGQRGRHARSAIGCVSLPLGAPVEIEMIVKVLDDGRGR